MLWKYTKHIFIFFCNGKQEISWASNFILFFQKYFQIKMTNWRKETLQKVLGWWYLPLWRYSRPAWTRSCAACCRRPCFGRGVGLDDPQRSLPTPTILWFCDLLSLFVLFFKISHLETHMDKICPFSQGKML